MSGCTILLEGEGVSSNFTQKICKEISQLWAVLEQEVSILTVNKVVSTQIGSATEEKRNVSSIVVVVYW